MHTTIFLIAVCYIIIGDIESSPLAPRFNARKMARLRYRDHEPIRQNPIIDKLAQSIKNGFLNSDVLGEHAYFLFDATEVYAIFYRIGVLFLELGGFEDRDGLADLTARAGKEVGLVKSELYFETIGYDMAKFFYARDILWEGNVDLLSISFITNFELAACLYGLSSGETVMNAVVVAIHRLLDKLSLVSYENFKLLFYIFAEEIAALSAKY